MGIVEFAELDDKAVEKRCQVKIIAAPFLNNMSAANPFGIPSRRL